MGEDIVATQLVLPAGHTLRPVDLGAIAASGHANITVARKPRVAIIPTGSELVSIGKPVQAGDIIEYNSVLAAQVIDGVRKRGAIRSQRIILIRSASGWQEAAGEHDLILLNAGSSAGSEDFSSPGGGKIGALLVHGVAVRPGHPVILGMIGKKADRIPIIGMPGYPVSSILTGEIFVEPLIARWLGKSPHAPLMIKAMFTRK